MKKHLFYFHVSEFKYLKSYLSDIGGVFEILSELANNSLDALVKGNEFVLSKRYLFSKVKHFGKVMGLEYGSILGKIWKTLSKTPIYCEKL